MSVPLSNTGVVTSILPTLLTLLQEIKKLEKEMNDYGDDYHALIELAENFGLDIQQLSNTEATIPKLIKNGKVYAGLYTRL